MRIVVTGRTTFDWFPPPGEGTFQDAPSPKPLTEDL